MKKLSQNIIKEMNALLANRDLFNQIEKDIEILKSEEMQAELVQIFDQSIKTYYAKENPAHKKYYRYKKNYDVLKFDGTEVVHSYPRKKIFFRYDKNGNHIYTYNTIYNNKNEMIRIIRNDKQIYRGIYHDYYSNYFLGYAIKKNKISLYFKTI